MIQLLIRHTIWNLPPKDGICDLGGSAWPGGIRAKQAPIDFWLCG